MKVKSVVTAALGLFVVASIAYMAAPKSQEKPASAATPSVTLPGKTVIVYYFHGGIRCQSCMRIESLTKQALDESYAKPMAQGKLIWKPISVEDPGNEHYVQDYELANKSVVVSELKDGKQVRWSNLKRVWELLQNEAAFKRYIRDEVAEILETD